MSNYSFDPNPTLNNSNCCKNSVFSEENEPHTIESLEDGPILFHLLIKTITKILVADDMQYHSCVCILGHAEPQNWFDSGVGRYCIPLYLVKIPFWYSYYIFWHSILTFVFKNTKLSFKKKADPYFLIFWVGRKRANKHFFLGLVKSYLTKMQCSNQCVQPFSTSHTIYDINYVLFRGYQIDGKRFSIPNRAHSHSNIIQTAQFFSHWWASSHDLALLRDVCRTTN